MVRTIIIDDSPHAVEYLSNLLTEVDSNIMIAGTANSVAGGIELIRKENPELVFLDIELGSQTGFDLLSQLTEINFNLVFTTAHNQYAIDAFKFNAIHYLLKPIQVEELRNAIQRIKLRPESSRLSVKDIDSLLDRIQMSATHKIQLCTEEGIRFVDVSNIVYIKADGSYSIVKMTNGKSCLLSRLLKDFEEQLLKHSFFRLSKSYLVNMQQIAMYRRIDGGTVEMSDGTLILVPRRKREEFIMKMAKSIG